MLEYFKLHIVIEYRNWNFKALFETILLSKTCFQPTLRDSENVLKTVKSSFENDQTRF